MAATRDDTTVKITRLIDAPVARVFNAWVDRQAWQCWIGPEGQRCNVPLLDARVGGRYRINMRLVDGSEVLVGGEYRIIDAPRLLEFTWGADGDTTRQSLIRLNFVANDAKTELFLCQEGLPTVASRNDHSQGWNSTINKLSIYLASQCR